MLITKAYKTELDPTKAQVAKLERHAEVSRYVYNWALARRRDVYDAWKRAVDAKKKRDEDLEKGVPESELGPEVKIPEKKSLSRFELNRELTLLKQQHPWLYEASNYAAQSAIVDLCQAFENFFRRVAIGAEEVGYPKFKNRFQSKQSFRLYGSIHVGERSIQLPNIGVVKLKEASYLPTSGVKILNVTVSKRVDRWYASLQVEENIPDPAPPVGGVIAVHFGVRQLATVSTGQVVENPRILIRMEAKLARLQQKLARQKLGSNKRQKTKLAIGRLHRKIAQTRSTLMHQASHRILATNRPAVVKMEAWNIKGMVKRENALPGLSKRMHDAAMGEFRRQVEYKAPWMGAEARLVDHPACSKTCHVCGWYDADFDLSKLVFRCKRCGNVEDRETNAVLNTLACETPCGE